MHTPSFSYLFFPAVNSGPPYYSQKHLCNFCFRILPPGCCSWMHSDDCCLWPGCSSYSLCYFHYCNSWTWFIFLLHFHIRFPLHLPEAVYILSITKICTRCVFCSLAPTSLRIPLQKQRGLHSILICTKRVPLAHSVSAGQWKAELLRHKNMKFTLVYNYYWQR